MRGRDQQVQRLLNPSVQHPLGYKAGSMSYESFRREKNLRVTFCVTCLVVRESSGFYDSSKGKTGMEKRRSWRQTSCFWDPYFFHFKIFNMPEDQTWGTMLWTPLEPWQCPRLCLPINPRANLMCSVHIVACEVCFSFRKGEWVSQIFVFTGWLFSFLWMLL